MAAAWGIFIFLGAAVFSFSQVDSFYLKAFADGEKAFAAGDFSAAAQRFEIAAFGLHADKNALAKAWGYLCVASYKAGQIEKSREIAQKLEELTGTSGLDGLGMEAGLTADIKKLVKYFKESLQPRGTAAGDRTKELPAAQASKEGTGTPEDKLSADREKALTRAVKADPKNATLYLDLYDFYVIQKKAKEAKATLEKLADKVPDEPQGRYLLGKMLYSERKFKDALKHFENVLLLTVKKQAASSLPLTSRGYIILCQNALGRKKDVARQCAEFRRAVPGGDTGALDMTDKDKARLQSVLDQNPPPPVQEKEAPTEEPPPAKAELSPAAPPAVAGRKAAAESPKAQPPKEVASAYGVYDQYLQNDDRAAARRTLQSILRKYPQERRAHFLLAKMDYQDNNYKEANAGFRSLLEDVESMGLRDDTLSEAAAYLILGVEKEQGLDAARAAAAAYQDLLRGPALDSLSLEGSDKQRVRDLLESRADSSVPARILSAVLIKKSEDSLTVEILYSPPTTYRTFVLRAERKIILDLFNVSEVRSDRIIPVNSLGLQSVRTGMFENHTARIVLDASEEIPAYDLQQTATGLVIIIGKRPSGPGD